MQVFDNREQASVAAAAHLTQALDAALQNKVETTFIVTGGSSPRHCYAALADTPLAWDRVHCLLSDERWVAPDHDDSNERMIRETFLTGAAEPAILHPFFQADISARKRCDVFDTELRQLPWPAATCLLGMGEDGHIASLFPDAVEDPTWRDAYCLPVSTAASPHPRVSLSLKALLCSHQIVLLFFGEAKRRVYEQAAQSENAFPVSRILQQNNVPVTAFWSP